MPDPTVCARCAAINPTCCRIAPGQEDVCFPLSVLEKDRIRDVAPDSGGFALSPNSAAFMGNMYRLFPEERHIVKKLFPERKEHWRLAVGPDGACRFLGAAGCVLPVEVRPYYCRLFPFWFTGGRLTPFQAEGCLAGRESRTTGRLLLALDSSTAKVKDLYGRLRMAWGFPPEPGMEFVERGF